MVRTIRFYNRDGRWYADLPDYIEQGGTEEDCEMVAGADTWLEYLSTGVIDNLFITLGDEPFGESLHLYYKDEYGATYIAHSYNEEDINHQLWLCPVTLFLFPDYPDIIYYKVKGGLL